MSETSERYLTKEALLQGVKRTVEVGLKSFDAPVLMRTAGQFERLKPTGAAIGMFADLNFKQRCLTLAEGDSIIAFTDGVTDARSKEDEPFGEERLLQVLSSEDTLQHRLKKLEESIIGHIDDAAQFDDITFVGFERTGQEQ